MGLDQYLKARRYIGAWEYAAADKNEHAQYDAIMRTVGKPGFRCEGSPSLYVEVNVAYWRKANQIHAWFVENVQNGVDDCDSYGVTAAQLTELRDLCQTVVERSAVVPGMVQNGTTYSKEGKTRNFQQGGIVADPSAAIELLPTTSGFFFGGTDYDEYYVEDLKLTIAQLNTALSAFAGWDFEYRSSW